MVSQATITAGQFKNLVNKYDGAASFDAKKGTITYNTDERRTDGLSFSEATVTVDALTKQVDYFGGKLQLISRIEDLLKKDKKSSSVAITALLADLKTQFQSGQDTAKADLGLAKTVKANFGLFAGLDNALDSSKTLNVTTITSDEITTARTIAGGTNDDHVFKSDQLAQFALKSYIRQNPVTAASFGQNLLGTNFYTQGDIETKYTDATNAANAGDNSTTNQDKHRESMLFFLVKDRFIHNAALSQDGEPLKYTRGDFNVGTVKNANNVDELREESYNDAINYIDDVQKYKDAVNNFNLAGIDKANVDKLAAKDISAIVKQFGALFDANPELDRATLNGIVTALVKRNAIFKTLSQYFTTLDRDSNGTLRADELQARSATDNRIKLNFSS